MLSPRCVVQYSPTILVLGMMGWSYYAYSIQFCFGIISNSPKRWIYFIVYQIFYFMFVWSYLRVIFASTSNVPKEFQVTPEECESIKGAQSLEVKNELLEAICRRKSLIILTRDSGRSIRFCYKCQLIKPDRAHHCSVCEKCILKMDHHCPWVGSCISFFNYKFFILFLLYGSIMCIFIASTTLETFLSVWRNTFRTYAQMHTIVVFLMSVTVGVMITAFFFYHTSLALDNRTTLETFRKPDFKHSTDNLTFDMGKYNNFVEIFGLTRWKWLLPLKTSLGNGINFPAMVLL